VFITLVLTATLVLVLVFVLALAANAEQVFTFIPNICKCQASRTRSGLTLFVVILREQCGRRRVRFVVQWEKLRARFVLLVRGEIEG
jgi:hypothetical protein